MEGPCSVLNESHIQPKELMAGSSLFLSLGTGDGGGWGDRKRQRGAVEAKLGAGLGAGLEAGLGRHTSYPAGSFLGVFFSV